MKFRSAAERLAIHLMIFFALSVPVYASGLQASAAARLLKTGGGVSASIAALSASPEAIPTQRER